MAGISIKSCKAIDSHKNIVITTNSGSRIDQLVKKSKTKWLINRNIVKIYEVDQSIWDVDIDECLKMTTKWVNRLNVK